MPAKQAIRSARHGRADDFDRIAELIGRTVGIKLPSQKRLMVESRLRKRFHIVGCDSFESYCSYVFDEGGLEDEFVHLVDMITTNKTDFFREADHLKALAETIVPELLSRRMERSPLLKVWSAASSTGAEAWSIAMVLEDLAEQGGAFTYAVLGTDISTAVLETARRAIYPAEAIKPVPREFAAKYLLWGRSGGARAAEVRIAPALRRKVHFERLNLMDPSYPYDTDVDLIFLRNVLIYFGKEDQELVVSRLVSHLRRHGYLIVGHSESMVATDPRLRQVGPAIFQRI